MVPYAKVSPDDYEELNIDVTFLACEKQRCFNISIVNDLINEPEETFTIHLSTISTLSYLDIHPDTGEVIITDDDGNT